MTTEEAKCETHFSQNVTRDGNGRYVVRLPFRENHRPLDESRTTTLRRFHALEHKLSTDDILRTEYA